MATEFEQDSASFKKAAVQIEAQAALGIAQSMAQSLDALERYWTPSKRGSNAQRVLTEIKQKRAAIEQCLRDALKPEVTP